MVSPRASETPFAEVRVCFCTLLENVLPKQVAFGFGVPRENCQGEKELEAALGSERVR